MNDWGVERTIEADTPTDSLPNRVPAELWDYAKAFLQIQRPMLRFVWRDDNQWLDVQLSTTPGVGPHQMKIDRVFVRIRPSEMPRGLTVRELDVLTLVALGYTNGGIAERLGTSARTVSTQLERLLEKMSQGSRGGLAALAVDLGLLRLPLPGGLPEPGGIGVAELELAYGQRLGVGHRPIREEFSSRSPLKLGILTPGASTSDGVRVLGGAMLAIDEINQQGGIASRSIEPVVIEVDMFDWTSVDSGLDQLFAADVDAIISSYVSAEHPQMLDQIADYGKPFLHTATFDADVQRSVNDPWRYGMIFQTCASETHYAPGMLRLLEQLSSAGSWSPKTHTIVPIELDSASMRLTTAEFRAAAEARGWHITEALTTPAGATDWKAVVDRALMEDPDAILFANYLEQEFISFQQEFLLRDSRALIYGIYAPSDPAFVRGIGAGADGVIWSTTTGTYDDEIGHRFSRNYRAKYREDPGWSIAGSTYDQVRMLASAWSVVDADDVAGVLRHLRRWPYRGVNGVYYFGEHGHTPQLYPDTTNDAALSQAHLVYQIQHGEHVRISPEPFGRLADFKLPGWITRADGSEA